MKVIIPMLLALFSGCKFGGSNQVSEVKDRSYSIYKGSYCVSTAHDYDEPFYTSYHWEEGDPESFRDDSTVGNGSSVANYRVCLREIGEPENITGNSFTVTLDNIACIYPRYDPNSGYKQSKIVIQEGPRRANEGRQFYFARWYHSRSFVWDSFWPDQKSPKVRISALEIDSYLEDVVLNRLTGEKLMSFIKLTMVNKFRRFDEGQALGKWQISSCYQTSQD